MAEKPYSRGDYNKALVANALLDPFGVVLLAIMLIVGIVVGALPVLGPAGVLLYLASATRTYFDQDTADKVLARQKGERAKQVAAPKRMDPTTLTPGIRAIVLQARDRETRIRAAIAAADLPYDEIAGEVDGFVSTLEDTARRAQSLADALRDTPPDKVAARLAEVRNDPNKKELADALKTQLDTLHRMQAQLVRFGDEMERILVELDTIRGQIVSVGATAGNAKSKELAGEVRSLREQMGAVADGMSAAYEDAQ